MSRPVSTGDSLVKSLLKAGRAGQERCGARKMIVQHISSNYSQISSDLTRYFVVQEMQTNLGFLQGSLNMQVEEIAQKKQKKTNES